MDWQRPKRSLYVAVAKYIDKNGARSMLYCAPTAPDSKDGQHIRFPTEADSVFIAQAALPS